MKSKRNHSTLLLYIAVVFLGMSGIVWFNQTDKTRIEPASNENKNADPFIEISVKEIALKFNCVCGKCESESLEICTCEQAVKERLEIKKSLQKGLSQDNIIALINNTYGGKKL